MGLCTCEHDCACALCTCMTPFCILYHASHALQLHVTTACVCYTYTIVWFMQYKRMITSLILGGLTGTETGLLGSNRAPWSNTPAAVTCWGGYPAGFTCGGCWAEVIRIQPYDSSQPHAQCMGYESLSGNKPGTYWPHICKMHAQNLMPCREVWSKASTEAWSINSKFSFLKSSIKSAVCSGSILAKAQQSSAP